MNINTILEKILNKIKMLFIKNSIQQIEASKVLETKKENDFLIMLKRQANPEADDRNGYRIKPNIRLKDMI